MAKKISTKSRIIEAAWKLFRAKGYEETTIEDIIALSGTSKGTFYHYFAGKDALLSSLSDLFDSYYEELYPSLPKDMNRVDMLIELCQRVHQMIGEEIQLNVLAYLYSSQVVTKGNRHLLDQNRFYYQMIREIVEDGFRRGEIRSDLTTAEVSRIYSMCERAIIYDYCICDGAVDLGKYTTKMIPILLAGLRA
ncbi:MAG: TetR/AcrR family transcriptional regulator [Lachnospiraceae bacterium]|nr:TetR/AcrR family transcriptional regulator [Lachnospiraceae bacterium]